LASETATAPRPRPALRSGAGHRRTQRHPVGRRHGLAYLLIAPAVLSALAFVFVPMLFSLYWSFTEYNGFTDPQWVGLDNYRTLLSTPRFQQALGNSLEFVLISMSLGPALGLGTALLLHAQRRLVGLFRSVYFLPVTVSLVATATVWKLLLNDSGLVNTVLRAVGLPGHSWLTDTATALPAVAFASVWQGFGFETVIFLAALQSVPRELHDAASVDGAGAVRRFWHVTLPALRPTLLFVFVYGIIGGFQVFDQIFVMTGGGPLGSTTTVVSYLVDRFHELDLGTASAASYVLAVILAVLSYFQLRIYRRTM
jgi:multiple sugar transport system permease protein